MMTETLYSDKLVTITGDTITFNHYYYPSGKMKVVRLENISHIVVRKPTIWSGKWRLHGTGNLKMWYPKDFRRPKRDRIFHATLKNQWVDIGFTVEDGERVETIFRQKNLIKAAT